MSKIFRKNKIYSGDEINKMSVANDLATVDCLKDKNMISIEEWHNGEGGDCLFEFTRKAKDKFLLTWSYFDEIKKLGIKPYDDRLNKYL